MATTAQQIFIQTMALADEMTDTINTVNASDTASYLARTPGILTLLQSELVRSGDLYKTFEFSQRPILPLGGEGSGFDIVPYEGTEVVLENDGTAKAYSIDVDGEATILVEDFDGAWHTLATITATDPSTRAYVTYKGTLTPTVGATKTRFRLTGSYEYNVTNYGLFNQPMKLARIPQFAPWVKVTMPTDFKSLEQVVNEYPDSQYTRDEGYKWENHKDLYVSYYYEGTVRVSYRPVPGIISVMTDSMELEDTVCRTIVPYGLMAELFKEENEKIAQFARQRYSELKNASMLRKPASAQPMTDAVGVMSGGLY